ncbi:MAG: winged helix DNA-binding domain-containing protein [Candidatus Hodarchaeota archaeon]
MINITLKDINKLVLYKHHLTEDSRTRDLIEVVKDIAGLHATIPMTPYLSLFARIDNFTKDLLDEELYVKRLLGKIRSIRRTLYIFPHEMILTIHLATNKMVEKQSRKALEFRGISLDTYKSISESILGILKDKNKEMTSLEIKAALQTKLNISYILYLMCDQMLLIRTRPRKYFPFDEYFPNFTYLNMKEIEAIILLVQYYLRSFGPVSEEDIIWWTGLRKTQIKRALNQIQDEILQVRISNLNKTLLMLQSDIELIEKSRHIEKKVINLLPALDPYIMGYKERERYFLSNNHYSYVFDRTGNGTSVILYEGRIIGVWDVISDERPILKFFLFEDIEDELINLITQKAQKIGKFVSNKEVMIKECDSMIPLNERTAGSFMSPLKKN